MANKNLQEKLIVCGIIAVIGVLYLSTVNSSLNMGGDNAIYLTLAKSLVSTREYRMIYYPDNPPHFLYPPLFPLILSPIIYVWGYHLSLIKILIILFGLLGYYYIYTLFKSKLEYKYNLSLIILSALSVPVLVYFHTIQPEAVYLLTSVLSLICFERYFNEKDWVSKNGGLCLFFLISSYYLRTAGITLLLGMIIFLLGEGFTYILLR